MNIEKIEKKALSLIESSKESDYPGEILYRASLLYRKIGNLTEAFKLNIEAVDKGYYESTSDLFVYYQNDKNIISINKLDKYFDKAIKAFGDNECYKEDKALLISNYVGSLINSNGLLDKENLDSIVKLLKTSLMISESSFNYGTLGFIYSQFYFDDITAMAFCKQGVSFKNPSFVGYGVMGTIEEKYGHYKKALSYHKKAIKCKDYKDNLNDSYSYVGRFYEFGFSGKKNPKKALKYYMRALKKGETCAYGQLAHFYFDEENKDTYINRELAKEYALKGIDLGDVYASLIYADILKDEDNSECVKYYETVATLYPSVKEELAYIYEDGVFVKRDYHKAYQYIKELDNANFDVKNSLERIKRKIKKDKSSVEYFNMLITDIENDKSNENKILTKELKKDFDKAYSFVPDDVLLNVKEGLKQYVYITSNHGLTYNPVINYLSSAVEVLFKKIFVSWYLSYLGDNNFKVDDFDNNYPLINRGKKKFIDDSDVDKAITIGDFKYLIFRKTYLSTLEEQQVPNPIFLMFCESIFDDNKIEKNSKQTIEDFISDIFTGVAGTFRIRRNIASHGGTCSKVEAEDTINYVLKIKRIIKVTIESLKDDYIKKL